MHGYNSEDLNWNLKSQFTS